MQNDFEVSPPIPVQAALQMKIPALYLQFYNIQVQSTCVTVKQNVMPACELSEICIVRSQDVYQCLIFNIYVSPKPNKLQKDKFGGKSKNYKN